MTNRPAPEAIAQVMRETSMGELQAYRHLQARKALADKLHNDRRLKQ